MCYNVSRTHTHTHTWGEDTRHKQSQNQMNQPESILWDQKEHCVCCVVEFIYYLRPVEENSTLDTSST